LCATNLRSNDWTEQREANALTENGKPEVIGQSVEVQMHDSLPALKLLGEYYGVQAPQPRNARV
jgi:hypothetical protein